jgi:glycosyltransferase involved in cell wall biosynthesis
MRILIALTYYRPHVSGLTIYAERLARGLAARGHGVTVLTSRFDPALARDEVRDGVRIRRVPVARKISKGVVMPAFAAHAWPAVGDHDVVNVHMPQLEAPLLAEFGRRRGRPVVLTYQCDLRLPPGWLNRIVERMLRPLNSLAAARCDRIVTTSDDYARHSPFLARHASKLRTIPPLVDGRDEDPSATRLLVDRWGLDRGPLIGFAARFAAEKGVEVLLDALPRVIAEFPDVRVAFTGAYRDTIGEGAYLARLQPALDRHRDRLVFLDLLPDAAMPSFYALCDVLAVTSLNSTEAYGLVQPEAMRAGTPVVASDLPGVREPVRRTGMGRTVPPGNPEALADALVDVLRNRDRYRRDAGEVRALFDPDASLRSYEQLFEEVSRS